MGTGKMWIAALLSVASISNYAKAELTPPYFNLTEKRNISLTCGVDSYQRGLYNPYTDFEFNSSGFRFGLLQSTYIEFDSVQTKLKKSYDVSLRFKTSEPDGVLFYAADSCHTDFIGLYLQGGKVIHKFKIGRASLMLESTKEYNDDRWHTVMISRQQLIGKLIINADDEEIGVAPGIPKLMTVHPPFSFGGVNTSSVEDMNKNLVMNLGSNKNPQFAGCITDIHIGGTAIDEPSKMENVFPCSEQVESGAYFEKEGNGYIRLKEKFNVGTETIISFDIKPRTMDALLLSAYGRKDYLIIELINGSIHFTVDSGASGGAIVSIFNLDDNESLCDGNWHTITAIKANFMITLNIDSKRILPTIGSASNPSTDTSRPLFLGGHPYINRARGLTIRRPFVGCIKNVQVKNEQVEIEPSMRNGRVHLGVCPTI